MTTLHRCITGIVLAALLVMSARALQGQSTLWDSATASPDLPPFIDNGYRVVHESTTGDILLFGSQSGVAKTLRFTVATEVWQDISPAVQPSTRGNFAMAHDSGRGVTVLYGGVNGMTRFDDTWEFDGTAWTEIATTLNPSLRVSASMSYDAVAGGMVLTGGESAPPFLAEDYTGTWFYDGLAWTELSSSTPVLGVTGTIASPAMAYDAVRGVHVIYGGFANTLSTNAVYEFAVGDLAWSAVTMPAPPPILVNPRMNFDPLRQVCVLHGVPLVSTGENLETWLYDGTSWTQETVLGDSPSFSGPSAIDPLTGDIVVAERVVQAGLLRVQVRIYRPERASNRPGSSHDLAIFVDLNGILSLPQGGEHELSAGTLLDLRLLPLSPALANRLFALIASPTSPGAAASGLSLLGGGAADVWVDPTSAIVLIDSLSQPDGLFAPRLNPTGFRLGPYPISSQLAGTALVLQVFANLPGANPVNLVTSNGVVLEFP